MAFLTVPSDKPILTAKDVWARFPDETHRLFMRRAITNSRKAGVELKTGGAFGAVIVDRDGAILADGINHVIARNDPTWHAEIHAIRQACDLRKSPKLEGCLLYSSAEPCPMCLAAAYWTGLDGIFYAATVADAKEFGNFDDAFIFAELDRPHDQRAIPELPLLRSEAIGVWKEYAALPDKPSY